MAYGKDWQTLILFEGFIYYFLVEKWRQREREKFLCAWCSLGMSLQRQWWVQMAPFRKKDVLGGFFVWKHQTCRGAVGQWHTGRSVEDVGVCT